MFFSTEHNMKPS